MSSVSQIVRKIIDDLSDGVSELALLVVVLAEQNAAIPDQLPSAAEIVNKTARGLATIARELAKADYAEFPEISKEINEAASAVDSATNGMDRAVNILKTSRGDRKDGWNGLVDSCRIMSGKTVRLLQIVYGADLKRLQLTADQLKDDIDRVDTSNLNDPRKQQDFAAQIQPLVTKALKLANYVNDRADDQDSPYSRDLLKNAALGLREGAQDLVNAGNAALNNPELAPKVDEALGTLRKRIDDTQKLVDELTPKNPTMEKLGRLAPLIDSAIAAVERLPPATKEGTPEYNQAEKDVKDKVGEVVKAAKANPKTKREGEDINDDMLSQILAGRKEHNNPNPNNAKDLDNATQKLLDALRGLKKTDARAKDISPEDFNDFKKALENLRKNLGPSTYPKVEDQTGEAFDRLLDNVRGTRKAVGDKDPDLGTHHLKQMWGNGKELADKLGDQFNKRPDVPKYQRQNVAAKDMTEELLPRVLRKGKPAMANPNDAPAGEDLLDALRRLRRAMDRMKPEDEKDMRDAWLDLLRNLRKVRDAGANNKPQGIDEGLKNIQDALKNLRRAADRRALQHPDDPESILGPMKEIETLSDQFRREAVQKDVPSMDKTIPKIEDAWRRLDRAAKASEVGAIQDLENAIDDVMASADLANADRLVPSVKDTIAKLDIVDKLVAGLTDPRQKQIGDRAMNILRPGIKDFVEAAKAAVRDPDNPTWLTRRPTLKTASRALWLI